MSRPCPALAAPRTAGRRAGAAGPAEGPLAEDLLAFLASEEFEFATKMGPGDTRRQSAVEPAAPGARAAQGGRQRARRGRGGQRGYKGGASQKGKCACGLPLEWRHKSRAAE